MFELSALYVMVSVTFVTSAIGAFYLFRRVPLINLNITTRNFMYAGACCAMSFGFLGAAYCVGSFIMTPWHVVAAVSLVLVGICATAHVSVDLGERLRIL